MAGDFKAEYIFLKDNLIIMRHRKGQFLRIDPQDHNQPDGRGGAGRFAQWNVELDGEEDDLPVIKLKSAKSGGYLRIHDEDDPKLDVGGSGGKWTRFKVHKTGANSAKLESVELPGKYPAVQPKGPAIGGGGQWTEFHFFRKGRPSGKGDFKTEYGFSKDNLVIMRHRKGQFLRIDPKDHNQPDGKGGAGGFAQWNVELDGEEDDLPVIKLKSAKSGGYLRIHDEDDPKLDVGGSGGKWTRFKVHKTGANSAKLESVELPGKYPAVQPKGPAIGGGGQWTEFHFFCKEEDEPEPEPVEEEVVEEEQKEEEEEVEPEPEPEEEPEPEPEEPEEEPEPETEPVPEDEPPAEEVEEEPKEEEVNDEEDVKEEYIDPSDQHPQPLPDARPSINPSEEFDDDIAASAAEKLRKAMKGLGTNEKKIIEVTNAYSHAQRMQIKAAYNTEYDRDLVKDLKKELGGKFEKMCVGFWLDAGRFDAELINEAVDGIGFSTAILNEVICTRTNDEIEAMKNAWWKGQPLIERVADETKKILGSGNYQNLLTTILEGKRSPNGPVNSDKAQLDAECLNRFLSQESESDAKRKFVEIFTTRSWVQIREISGIFQDVSKKYTLNGAIQHCFGDGDTSKALQVIDEFASQPYDYWAKKLRDAMKGMGTDDAELRRILVARAEIDLRDIGIVFGQRYGDGKTLQKWLKDDLGGDYEKLCLAVCGLD